MRISSALRIFQMASFSRYVVMLSFFTLLVFSLLICDVYKVSWVQESRMALLEGMSPILNSSQKLNQASSGFFSRISDFFNAYEKLDELKDENKKLLRWKTVALSLMSENKALRDHMNVVPESFKPVVTARVLTYPAHEGVHRIIIQAGEENQIEPGQVVVSPKGVIGRILRTNAYAAEVLLITDGQSRIPVTIEPAHQQAILAGTQSHHLELDHLENSVDITEGMQVFTSGKGGIFPPGLYLGMTSKDGDRIIIEPNMNWKDLDYVQILMQPHIGLDE
ncbi:MAG: rod shape-determining protein MreC [Alphaproteobacteria bacterium]|nr:rod shape-determining protein MreC [Alphaproteobacteria bacterium]